MKKSRIFLSFVVAISTISPLAKAQTTAMCAGLAEAAKWPKERDAVQAAPKNHRVIYESDELRVLEVTVTAGEREIAHHHQWPSVMVVDQRPSYVNYDKDGKAILPAVGPAPELPIMVRLPAQPEHAIHNTDTRPFHAIRIEYKKLCGTP